MASHAVTGRIRLGHVSSDAHVKVGWTLTGDLAIPDIEIRSPLYKNSSATRGVFRGYRHTPRLAKAGRR